MPVWVLHNAEKTVFAKTHQRVVVNELNALLPVLAGTVRRT